MAYRGVWPIYFRFKFNGCGLYSGALNSLEITVVCFDISHLIYMKIFKNYNLSLLTKGKTLHSFDILLPTLLFADVGRFVDALHVEPQ